MKYKWLSYPLDPDAPRPPAIPAPRLTEFMSIKNDGANVLHLECYNHTGTHLDTARHVFEEGVSLEDFCESDLMFNCIAVVELRLPDDTVITANHLAPFAQRMKDAEMLIVRLGVENIRKEQPERFSKHSPGFGHDAADFILKNAPNLRCIGTDVPSIACINSLDKTMTVHHFFFEHASIKKFIIIEEMKLDTSLAGIEKIIVSPWMVKRMDSGPCVIWAVYK